ncbi:MAG: mechanosensitive ion channel [Pigmentiphaga sp.]|uniref:mechanosensitive ion channel n=1 Tax=Pigmentiphaga sp. TaxID=1977564 RepID=UPI0029A36B8E|nr:mechanosensitive ion channel [Pigmentiphaga sp.]MDX3904321.1 mechanosensitive ion channel [Pigmentiphaga sp.]
MFDNAPRVGYLRDQLTVWGPRILMAIVILVITHFVARGVKWAVVRGIGALPFFSRPAHRPGQTLAESLGSLAYWIVWLVGLIVAMQPLGLDQAMDPIHALTHEVFSYAPQLIGAALIFFVGLIFAKIVRNIVETALGAVNFDRIGSRLGLCKPADAAADGNRCAEPLVRACGAIVFTLIIIPVSIAALQTLGISSIVTPAVTVLETVLDAIPRVVAAALLLAIALVIAQWVRQLVASTLASLGFDRALASIGIFGTSPTPSSVAAMVAMVAIMLFAAIEAASLLDFDAVAILLTEVTELGGQVIFGSVIILVGVIMGRIVARIVGDSVGESGLPSILKYAVIALAVAIGLRFMGLANEIVNLAFGLILGAAAVACALAFGLGGRQTAHELLQKWTASRPSILREPPPAGDRPIPGPEDRI